MWNHHDGDDGAYCCTGVQGWTGLLRITHSEHDMLIGLVIMQSTNKGQLVHWMESKHLNEFKDM